MVGINGRDSEGAGDLKSGALHAFRGCDFLSLGHLGGFKTESFLESEIWTFGFVPEAFEVFSSRDNPGGL